MSHKMEKIRVGAAQISPYFFDREKTLEKTCHYIREAGKLGLDLVVFPEVYFCGYPYWRGNVSVRQSTELAAKMIEAPSNGTAKKPIRWLKWRGRPKSTV